MIQIREFAKLGKGGLHGVDASKMAKIKCCVGDEELLQMQFSTLVDASQRVTRPARGFEFWARPLGTNLQLICSSRDDRHPPNL